MLTEAEAIFRAKIACLPGAVRMEKRLTSCSDSKYIIRNLINEEISHTPV